MHTILGSGGAIGQALARALKEQNKPVRLISRRPVAVNADDQLFSADLQQAEAVRRAVAGSQVVYLTVGLPYNTKLWQAKWPLFMRNTIEACKQEKAKLIFFDNVYMYDPKAMPYLTESTPVQPKSRKGAVRAAIANMLWQAIESGEVTALIARCADFYGPSIQGTSLLTEIVFKPLSKGKKALWFASVHHKHSFTYVPDAARAMVLLADTPQAFNQVWHLPTDPNPLSGEEWIGAVARALGSKGAFRVLSKNMVRLAGLLSPLLREMPEMWYQYDRDYVFDSSKFNAQFHFKPTAAREGIRAVARADFNR